MKKEEDKQKAEQIVNNQWQWIAEFIERSNLSKEDRNQIRFKMYDVCCEMAEWKEKQTIEKAVEWLKEQEELIGVSFQDDFLERFQNYMKGE